MVYLIAPVNLVNWFADFSAVYLSCQYLLMQNIYLYRLWAFPFPRDEYRRRVDEDKPTNIHHQSKRSTLCFPLSCRYIVLLFTFLKCDRLPLVTRNASILYTVEKNLHVSLLFFKKSQIQFENTSGDNSPFSSTVIFASCTTYKSFHIRFQHYLDFSQIKLSLCCSVPKFPNSLESKTSSPDVILAPRISPSTFHLP